MTPEDLGKGRRSRGGRQSRRRSKREVQRGEEGGGGRCAAWCQAGSPGHKGAPGGAPPGGSRHHVDRSQKAERAQCPSVDKRAKRGVFTRWNAARPQRGRSPDRPRGTRSPHARSRGNRQADCTRRAGGPRTWRHAGQARGGGRPRGPGTTWVAGRLVEMDGAVGLGRGGGRASGRPETPPSWAL